MQNLTQWKNALTGEVIQMVNGTVLPIPFRVENGGGSVLCGGASVCNSVTISNNDPSGTQVVTVEGGAGSIAGASFPNGWLPASGPQSVVVTISQVDIGSTDPVTGVETKPCHAGLPFQQFPGCFNFATTPALQPIQGTTDEFAKSVTVAVCYALSGGGDPREKFAEMYSSGPNEPAHALQDASDVGLLSPQTRNCTTNPVVIGLAGGTSLSRLASAAWRNTRSALGHFFGVKTAYAVDLGLGGLTKSFSNVGPVLPATMQPATFTDVTLDRGQQTTVASVKVTGNHSHSGAGVFSGVDSVPVTFTVVGNNGVLSTAANAVSGASVTVKTSSENSVDGIASISWTVPPSPGTYTMTATGPTSDPPIIFTATVPPLYDPWSGTATIASAGPVAFGGGSFCNYTVELDNVQGSLDLNATGGGSAVVTATQNEVAENGCPFAPAPPHLDAYASTSVTRAGDNVVVTLMPVGNPISASLNFVGTMSSDQQTVSGTFTWHRIDQTAPLDWTIVAQATLTRTPPAGSLTPALVFSSSEFYQANGFNWVRYRLGVTNYAVYPAEMFAARPDLPPCGLNTNASRTWVDIYDATNNSRIYGFCGLKSPSDLNLIWFAESVGTPPPAQVYIKLTDRATGAVYTSNTVTPVSPP
jgi:hypothetical protein